MPRPLAYTIADGRIQTRSLEAHIVDHCNLSCAHCCSLSPYLPKWAINPHELERDLAAARRVLSPGTFKLVGGEPLLHPQIDECLSVARQSQIAPVVSVTTNGLLLPRMSPYFWQTVQALTISLYPSPALPSNTLEFIRAQAATHSIPINWKKMDEFVQMDLAAPRTNEAETADIYHDCWLRERCHIVSRGRFFQCTRPPHFASLLKNPLFLDDGVKLDASPALQETILSYLQAPTPLATCSLCQGGHATTSPHRQLSADEVRERKTLVPCT